VQLPNHDDAIVEQVKVQNYLLSPVHPIGKAKAAWFRALGYSQSDWSLLQADLLKFAELDAVIMERTKYGQIYGVSGTLVGPNCKSGQILTIWISMAGQRSPRLVTAYPHE